MLDPAPLVRACADAGIPWRVQCLEECASTNATAIDALAADPELAENGLALFSDWQSAGRGRRGRRWRSEPGKDLLLSIAFRPPIGPARWSRYTHAAALAIVCALAPEFPTSVKWPNDIYLGGRKLAGLLLESRAGRGAAGSVVVIGIGLNVNTAPAALGENLDHPPTALCAEHAGAPAELDREPIAIDLLRALHLQLRRAEEDFPALLEELAVHSLLLGQAVELTTADGGRQRGTAEGLGPEGELLFRPAYATPSAAPLTLASAETVRLAGSPGPGRDGGP